MQVQEAGLGVNDVPRIHIDEPTVEDHSIFEEYSVVRIPLRLDGIFFYFLTRALNKDEMEHPECLDTIFLTPDAETWEPYNILYALNEDSFIDFGGDMVYPAPSKSHELLQ